MTATSKKLRLRSRLFRLGRLASLATVAGIMGYASQPDAKLKSYYFLEGLSKGETKPKILFVLDTSGSMTWVVGQDWKNCAHAHCEQPNHEKASRMAIARDVIQSIVRSTSESADFSLMSFSRLAPPSSSGQTPGKCSGDRRFALAWSEDGQKMWRLCGDNRPFPYLRHDNLGAKKVNLPARSTGPIPPSPINNKNPWREKNRNRKVQFFPEFLGNRVHFDSSLNVNSCSNIDTSSPDSSLLHAVCNSYGDYGNSDTTRKNKILGHDFYYWPYVDGFPGYSFFVSYDDEGDKEGYALGVAYHAGSSNGGSASLLAPFFLNSDASDRHAAEPSSRKEALNRVIGYTNPLISGGLDASGGTPWNTAIGPWTDSPNDSNAPHSHGSIASYVSYVNSKQDGDGLCSPLSVILLTDGQPNSTSNLYSRLANLRNKGKAETYVVGFGYGGTTLNRMACAAAGSADSSSPCWSPPHGITWDTCKNPKDPTSECAYVAKNKEQLADRLSAIVTGALKLDLQSGPSTSVNEFGAVSTAGPNEAAPDAIQTSVTAKTIWPGWKGVVKREVCEDKETDPANFVNGVAGPASHCDPTKLPFPDPNAERFGVCPLSRDWDASLCLKNTNWEDRRIYFVAPDKTLVKISDSGGSPTSAFRAHYNALYAAAAPADAGAKPSAEEFVQFVLGKDWPEGWKLPGLAQSSPIVVRRIPKKNLNYRPTVPIRDPHCAGRKLGTAINVPRSLEEFSDQAWDEDNKVGSTPHLPYQEAVLVGDDMGLLHAFHLDSGNEMWALLPHFALKSAIASYHHGSKNMGQPAKLADHVFGMGGTVNHAHVYQQPTDEHGHPTTDPNPANPGKWRHLAVIGMAQGGQELMALDVSHMSPDHPDGPVEVLWTSADQTTPPGSTETLEQTYDRVLGQTWSRPAISYLVPGGHLDVEPSAILVLGSGGVENSTPGSKKGKSYHVVDPLTGKLLDSARLPPVNHSIYGSDVSAGADIAVGTHCASRFWGEAEEAYFNDPAGRFYRWDLGADTDHSGDSVAKWTGVAKPVATFRACQGTADHSCTVQASNKGEPFQFAPAVVSVNRIDDQLAEGLSGIAADQKDNFLVAMVSGHLLDQDTDSGQKDADFHPSIYLIADDHRGADHHGGFSIPAHGAITQAGANEKFFRIPLSQLTRTRTFTPYPGATPIVEENQPFSRRARPVSAPRITVTGLVDSSTGAVREGIEVYYVEFNIFEPGIDSCDPRLYDATEKKRHQDPGSSYMIRLRLVADDESGFNFKNGASGLGSTLGADRYGFTKNGLQVGKVEQVKDDCEGGACGPKIAQKKFRPCVPENKFSRASNGTSVGLGYKVLDGFSPIEYNTSADKKNSP